MTDTFGFDPKTLKNDDLFSRQVDLTRKKVMAARLGRMEVVDQLDVMIRAIERERQERVFMDRTAGQSLSGVVIETDPSLAQRETGERPSTEPTATNVPTGRPVRRTVRTSAPVRPPEDGV